jgi:hypothetical protein
MCGGNGAMSCTTRRDQRPVFIRVHNRFISRVVLASWALMV